MFARIRKRIKTDFNAAFRSMKLREVEEWFDIYFSRFFGYYFALIGRDLHMTPNQMSVASLIIGLASGVLFYFQDNLTLIIWACFLITLSGVLDSADGQLARMTGRSSDLGRKIDAIIDTFVFVACYVGGALYFFQTDYSWWIFLVAGLGGYLHSAKSAAYEYYKTEFIYYVKGAKDHRISYVEELKKPAEKSGIWHIMLYYLEVDYTRKQALFHGRMRETRELFEQYAFSGEADRFRHLYTTVNEPIMTWWALVCGTNTHRTLLMVCSLFGRMDIYFFIAIVTFLPMLWVNYAQRQNDKKLVEAMEGARQQAMAH